MKLTAMAMNGFFLFQCLSFFLLLNMSSLSGAAQEDRKVYIVYMGAIPKGELVTSSFHLNILQEVVKESSVEDVLVRSYRRSFNGFAAKLTDHEREKLAGMEGVVSVFPRRILQLQTTRSWDFMGLNASITRKRSIESDIIVGVLDTGVWPEAASFSDEGFGPAPKKWKGACEGGTNFTCNNKLIGARDYTESGTVRDEEGHGTHTASTAAGNEVKDASFFGIEKGTIRGGVPSARIAAYKVCSSLGCASDAMLAAFDDAIADGVDIITISIGGTTAFEYDEDTIPIGSFHAMAKGVLTLNSAGNSGPDLGATSSAAPWIMSVAASTIDRLFVGKIVLGNGKSILGLSVNSFTMKGKKYPLVYGKEVSKACEETSAESCSGGCLDRSLVKGKIVICQSTKGFIEVFRAGGEGAIYVNSYGKVPFVVSLPAVAVTQEDLDSIISYKNSTKKPEAKILKTETINDSDAPSVADFSSRGPNTISPDILKPDITAPGVDILAAFSPLGPASKDPEDKRQAIYNIISGTSMSCPHVAGVAAYVKSFHPDWSPSSIKSAIMTTAWALNSSKHVEAEFAYGSGHVNPVQAINPGLVYETSEQDYITFLCSLGYDSSKLRTISGDNSTCPKASDKGSPKDLNYPSMAAKVSPGKSFTLNYSRTVTNVGLAKSTYKAQILKNPKIDIHVVPEVLSFKALKEKKPFQVTVTGRGLPDETIVSSSLVWSDGSHVVRSPIVVHSFSGLSNVHGGSL